MLFNSLNFAFFLPIVFVLYWFTTKGNYRAQNVLLFVSSYFFYACWDWRFLVLLCFSTIVDFVLGIRIYEGKNQFDKKFWFWLSIIINLGLLGIFKYYNFFISSLLDALNLIGINGNLKTIELILPVGISFYTFHGLSYVIDLYYGRIKPEKDFINYAVFVSFFPLLVAGPIERATHLLPQILIKRVFSYEKSVDGLKQILWGLFKKIVIADNCAEIVNRIFDQSVDQSGSTLLVGAFLFSFQIYGDFSGYSDIAIGTARLFGIDLLKNFAFPYFSRDFSEFWRRWHISLSSWFKDYIYIPLGGNKGVFLTNTRNILLIFLLSGLWHGANWTFIIWGLINAFFIVVSALFLNKEEEIVAKGKLLPSFSEFFQISVTFSLTTLAWIFFRSESVEQAIGYISKIFSSSLFTTPYFSNRIETITLFSLIGLFLIVEWLGREQEYGIAKLFDTFSRPIRWSFYYSIIIIIFLFGGGSQEFIYFQF